MGEKLGHIEGILKRRMFEIRALRKIFGTKRGEARKGCKMRSLMICTAHHMLFEWANQEGRYSRGLQQVCGRGEVGTGFWWGNMKERDHLQDQGIVGNMLKWILKK
jgi:hypothetical protein